MNHHGLNRFYEGKELALDYDKYRPSYPAFIAKKVLEYMSQDSLNSSNGRFSKLLDVGCGGGKSAHQFAPYFDSILGIDISKEMIEVARKTNRHDNVTFQLVHDNIFPVKDNSVDLVNCATALHFMDLKMFESECERVLKPNGCVAAYSYYPRNLENQSNPADNETFAEVHEKLMKDCEISPVYFSPSGYKDLFRKINNKNKIWIDNLSFTTTYTQTSFKKMLSTIGEYRNLSEKKTLLFDPLEDCMRKLRELLKCKAEEKEFEVTWAVPMFVFHKQ